MKLTSKGRYAVTAMLDVALHSKRGPVPLADISERQEISLSYLEQLFSRLRKEQLVDSVRGPGGGCQAGGGGSIARPFGWEKKQLTLKSNACSHQTGLYQTKY